MQSKREKVLVSTVNTVPAPVGTSPQVCGIRPPKPSALRVQGARKQAAECERYHFPQACGISHVECRWTPSRSRERSSGRATSTASRVRWHGANAAMKMPRGDISR